MNLFLLYNCIVISMFLVYYYILVNLWAFLLFFIDKRLAIKRKWRISEANLIVSIYLGGWLGAWGSMVIFHHKTKKWYFKVNLIIALVLHGYIISLLLT